MTPVLSAGVLAASRKPIAVPGPCRTATGAARPPPPAAGSSARGAYGLRGGGGRPLCRGLGGLPPPRAPAGLRAPLRPCRAPASPLGRSRVCGHGACHVFLPHSPPSCHGFPPPGTGRPPAGFAAGFLRAPCPRCFALCAGAPLWLASCCHCKPACRCVPARFLPFCFGLCTRSDCHLPFRLCPRGHTAVCSAGPCSCVPLRLYLCIQIAHFILYPHFDVEQTVHLSASLCH